MHAIVRAGLALAVGIALAACGSGATPATNAPAAASTAPAVCAQTTLMGAIEVEISDFTFKPDPIQAKVGETISWINKDDVPHSAALDGGLCATDTIDINGGEGGLKFSVPGTYAYHCAIHPTRMKGTIVVSG
jgi:plastocyanin